MLETNFFKPMRKHPIVSDRRSGKQIISTREKRGNDRGELKRQAPISES